MSRASLHQTTAFEVARATILAQLQGQPRSPKGHLVPEYTSIEIEGGGKFSFRTDRILRALGAVPGDGVGYWRLKGRAA